MPVQKKSRNLLNALRSNFQLVAIQAYPRKEYQKNQQKLSSTTSIKRKKSSFKDTNGF